MTAFETPFAGLLPKQDPETLEQIRTSLHHEGQKVPIEVDDELNVLDGHTRLALLTEMGITPRFEVVHGMRSTEEKELYVLRTAGQCRQLTPEGKRCLREEQKRRVLALRKSDPKRWTQQALAELSQVARETVRDWLSNGIGGSANVVAPPAAQEPKADARVKYTADQVREGLQNHADGLTIKAAAERVGMPSSTLSSHKRHALLQGTMPAPRSDAPTVSRRRELSPKLVERDEQVAKFYPRQTVDQVAAELGLTRSQVATSAQRQGLKKGKGRRKNNPIAPLHRGLRTMVGQFELWVDEEVHAQRARGGSREQYDEALGLLAELKSKVATLRKQLLEERP